MKKYEELLGRASADDRAEAAAEATPCTEGQQAGGVELGVIIANDRDRRTLAWLRECVGDAAIVRVTGTGRLAGNRKPYPTNIAKALSLPIPATVALPPSDLERVRERLAGLKSILKMGKAKAPEGDGV